MAQEVGVNEYARIRGCSGALVSQKIKKGVLSRSISRAPNGKPMIDPVIADLEWVQNTDSRFDYTERSRVLKELSAPVTPVPDTTATAAPGSAEPRTPPKGITLDSKLNDIRAVREFYAAENERLQFEEKIGKLVEADTVQREWLKMITEVKTKLLAVPVKAKALMPDLTKTDVNRIEALIREALEEVAYADEH